MPHVLNRTTKQYIESVHTPDYPSASWVISPVFVPDKDTILALPHKYRKVNADDTVSEMSAAEKTVADGDIERIDKEWTGEFKDYKAARAKIYASVVSAGGFVNLTAAQKIVASKWFVVTKSDRDTVHTQSQQVAYGEVFHVNSKESRRIRMQKAITQCYNRLTQADANTVINDANGLVEKYIEYGREGTVEGDPEELFDYIEARAGTTYVVTGLAAKTFVPTDAGTLAQLVTDLMNILKNGIY